MPRPPYLMERFRAAMAQRMAMRSAQGAGKDLTAEWFPEERAFFEDESQLAAACCGRRAGKTRGLVRDLLEDALSTPGFRGLYMNATRGEAERLAWHGNRGDGIASLVAKLGIRARWTRRSCRLIFLGPMRGFGCVAPTTRLSSARHSAAPITRSILTKGRKYRRN